MKLCRLQLSDPHRVNNLLIGASSKADEPPPPLGCCCSSCGALLRQTTDDVIPPLLVPFTPTDVVQLAAVVACWRFSVTDPSVSLKLAAALAASGVLRALAVAATKKPRTHA